MDAKSWFAHFKELDQVGNEKSSRDLYFEHLDMYLEEALDREEVRNKWENDTYGQNGI